MEIMNLTKLWHQARAKKTGIRYRIEQYEEEGDQLRVRRTSIEYNIVGTEIMYYEDMISQAMRELEVLRGA